MAGAVVGIVGFSGGTVAAEGRADQQQVRLPEGRFQGSQVFGGDFLTKGF
jgi:hypothetical protein